MNITRVNRCKAIGLILALLAVSVASAEGEGSGQGVVNINTATREQLMLLPRIGPAVAGRILDYRDANDGFKSTEELLLVRGIGEKTYQLLEPYVAVKGDTTLTEKVRGAGRSQSDED